VQAKMDVGMPRPTSADQCVLAKGDVGRPRPTMTERCAQATVDAGSPRPTLAQQFAQAAAMRAVHDQCHLADDACRWPTSLVVSQRRLPESYRPRQMRVKIS